MDKWHKEVVASELKTEKKVLNELHKTYEEASKQIDDKIAQLLGRSDANMQHVIYQVQYQQALKKQVDGVLDTLNGTQFTTVSDYLQKSYEDGFIGTLYTLQKQGVPLVFPIDQEQVTKAVINNSKIKEGLYKKLGIDVGDLKKAIRSEISRGISTGVSYADMARNVNNQMGIGLNKSIRIARTEGHRISQESRYDVMTKAKEAGADVIKQWDSTLDKRTRPHHQALDGQVRELDEPFEVAGRQARQPAGFGVASEDINCRCVVLEIGRWELDDDTGSTKMVDGEIKDFKNVKDYEEFKKQYWKWKDEPRKPIEPKITFEPSNTVAEAQKYVERFVDTKVAFGALGISYDGISVDSANQINGALEKLYSGYDLPKLGGVCAFKGNTKYGKKLDGAIAAYSDIRKSILLNTNALKNGDSIIKSKAEELRVLERFKKNPSSFHFSSQRVESVMKASLISGRGTVADTIEDVINHEMGHSIEGYVKKSSKFASIQSNMAKYASQISGYSTDSIGEYIAESFASYRKGEKLIDPELIDVFESLKKSSGLDPSKISNTAPNVSFLKRISSANVKTVILPKKEYGHVMHELNTNLTKQELSERIVEKNIGDYIYTIEVYEFNEYRIIGKTKIDKTVARIVDEVKGERK